MDPSGHSRTLQDRPPRSPPGPPGAADLAVALPEGLGQQPPARGHRRCHLPWATPGATLRHVPARGLSRGSLSAGATPGDPQTGTAGSPWPLRYLRGSRWHLPGAAKGGGKGGDVPIGEHKVIWGDRQGGDMGSVTPAPQAAWGWHWACGTHLQGRRCRCHRAPRCPRAVRAPLSPSLPGACPRPPAHPGCWPRPPSHLAR